MMHEYMGSTLFIFLFLALFYSFFISFSYFDVDIRSRLFLKMRDVANPEVNVKTGALLTSSFETFLMHVLESMGGRNMWDRKLKRFKRKLGFHNLIYVIIHMPP